MNPKYKINEEVLYKDEPHKVEFCNWDPYYEEWSYDLINTFDEELIEDVSEDLLKPMPTPKFGIGQIVVYDNKTYKVLEVFNNYPYKYLLEILGEGTRMDAPEKEIISYTEYRKKLIKKHTISSLTKLIKEIEDMTGEKDYDKYPPKVLDILDELTICKEYITDKL